MTNITLLEINTAPRHGFFSAFFGVLRAIRHAEIEGYIPYVVWDERSPYVQRTCKDSDDRHNAWTQYFEQITPEPVVTSLTRDEGARVLAQEWCGWDGLVCYPGQNELDTMRTLLRKYVRVRAEVLREMPQLPRGTVGVHYRGTDKITSGEFAAPPVQHLVDLIRGSALYTGKGKPFFFATDDIDALRTVTSAFPDGHVLYNRSCVRGSTSTGSVHRHYEYVSEKHTRTRDGPLKGKQVLLDALCLTQCRHLLRCPSGVSLFALVASSEEQTFMDYTEHTWEHFLLRTPRNVRFHDVMMPTFRQDFECAGRSMVRVSNDPDLFDCSPTSTCPHFAYLRRDTSACSSRGQDLFAVRRVHEIVNASALFDRETIEFAHFLLLSTGLVDKNDNDIPQHRPVLTCVATRPKGEFLIVCCRRRWEELCTHVIRPLYQEQIRYRDKVASVPLQMIGQFTMLLISLTARSIGIVYGG